MKKMLFIFILFLFFLFGCKTIDVGSVLTMTYTTIQATEKAARPISDEEEYFVGRAVAARLFQYYPPYDFPKLTQYVNLVGKTVALHSDRPFTHGGYHFIVLNSSEINAFACPGGIIFITRGMLQLAQSEDELAAILAHEIAHISNRDGINSIKQARWTEALTIIGTTALKQYGSADLAKLVSIFEGSIDDVLKTLVVNGYSKTQEYSADEKAIQYLTNAGYNPYALLNVIERISKYTAYSGGILKTHPDSAERISNLKEKIPVVNLDTTALKYRTYRFSSIIR